MPPAAPTAQAPTQSAVQANNTQVVSAPGTAPASAVKPSFRLPHEKTMINVAKLSISEDKPIMMDYWVDSLQKTAMIGVREDNNERMLVKSEAEYTSPIAKLFNVENDFIVMTENSIYIVDSQITRRKIGK
jgi:hypothetical protein